MLEQLQSEVNSRDTASDSEPRSVYSASDIIPQQTIRRQSTDISQDIEGRVKIGTDK